MSASVIAVQQRSDLASSSRGFMGRALVWGSAWGLPTTAGVFGAAFWSGELICLTDAAITAVLSVGVGVALMGPFLLFARSPANPPGQR